MIDVNSSKKVNFKFTPDNGYSTDMKVVVSKDKILSTDDTITTSQSDFTIHSGKKTGTVTLYIKDNRSDISSNKIKVKIEDKAAIKKAKEEAKRKAEEEKKEKRRGRQKEGGSRSCQIESRGRSETESRSFSYRITRGNGLGSKYRI